MQLNSNDRNYCSIAIEKVAAYMCPVLFSCNVTILELFQLTLVRIWTKICKSKS